MKAKLATEKKTQSFKTVYANTLDELLSKDKNVVVLDADLSTSSGVAPLFKKYPDNCVNFGIAEANMIGAAAGMSKLGLKPYTHSFAPFASRKTLDQLYLSAAYSKGHVHIYGSDAGIWSQKNGATHSTFDDIAIMRAIPEVSVFAPCDGVAFKWILEEYARNPGIFYTRGPRKNEVENIYADDATFEIGKANVLRQGKDVTIIAIGMMVHEALKAAQELSKQGIEVTVVDLFSIKPYDSQLLQELISDSKIIVAAENASCIGGIGELIGKEIALSKNNPKFIHIAIKDTFSEVGSLDYLKKEFGINYENIVEKIKEAL